jgi:cytochrome c551/c552
MRKARRLVWALLPAGMMMAGALPAQEGFSGQDRDPYLAMNRQLVAHGCQLCHASDYPRVGPAMRDVAQAALQDPATRARLKESIMKGTKGHWGAAVMPAQQQVTPQDADAIVAAILAVK